MDAARALSDATTERGVVDRLVRTTRSIKVSNVGISFRSLDRSIKARFLRFLERLSVRYRGGGLILSISGPIPRSFADRCSQTRRKEIMSCIVVVKCSRRCMKSRTNSITSLP